MPNQPTQEDLLATIQDAEKLLSDVAGLLPNHAAVLNEAAGVLKDLQGQTITLDLLLAGLSLLKSRPPLVRR